MSAFMAFAGMLLMFASFKKALDEKSKAAPIVNAGFALFFLILAATFSLVATTAYAQYAGMSDSYHFTFASGPVAGIVLIIAIVIPGLVVSNIFSSKKEQ